MSAARALLAVALACAAALPAHAQSLSPDQRAALDAAERWLVPVDAQRYDDAWAMAAESFKKTVDKAKWRDGIRELRRDYGRVVRRKAEKSAYVGGAPNPDDTAAKEGQRIAILFETGFARDRKATEEVTLERESDGLWRVAGYYIR